MTARGSRTAIAALELVQLRVLHALWRERSVARASERLYLTSSAVSHNLAKLRDLLGDELFVRGAGMMQPTPRMCDMAATVEEIIDRLETLVDPAPFDPTTSRRRFVVASLPYIATFFMPDVLTTVMRAAPEIQIRLISGGRNLVADLEARRIDLAIGTFGRLSPTLNRTSLFDDNFVLAVSRDNPLLASDHRTIDLSRLKYVEVEINSEAGELNEPFYGNDGLKRRLTLAEKDLSALGLDGAKSLPLGAVVPDTSTALALVTRTEMAAIIVESAARAYSASDALVLIPLSSTPPRLPVELIRNNQTNADAAVTWLADQLLAAGRVHAAAS